MSKDLKQNIFSTDSRELSDLSVKLRERCASFSSLLHPITAESIKKIIGISNAYYSCKTASHEITPAEIEDSLTGNFSKQKSKKLVQQEAKAYFETEIEIKRKILSEPEINICSTEFLSWIHSQLFGKLPDEFKRILGENGKIIYLVPGEFRMEEINHGNGHPKARQIIKLLIRFEEMFKPSVFSLADSPIALSLAHAMLSWINPFPVGSEMVIKLFTGAYFAATGLNGAELISVERALLNKEYDEAITEIYKNLKNLKSSDNILVDDTLASFCKFFLQTLLDEAEFKYKMLSTGNIVQKLNVYLNRLISEGEIRGEGRLVVKAAFLAGELKRGEALQITGRPERTARRILGELLQKNLLVSDTPKGPVRINFKIKSAMEILEGLI